MGDEVCIEGDIKEDSERKAMGAEAAIHDESATSRQSERSTKQGPRQHRELGGRGRQLRTDGTTDKKGGQTVLIRKLLYARRADRVFEQGRPDILRSVAGRPKVRQ